MSTPLEELANKAAEIQKQAGERMVELLENVARLNFTTLSADNVQKSLADMNVRMQELQVQAREKMEELKKGDLAQRVAEAGHRAQEIDAAVKERLATGAAEVTARVEEIKKQVEAALQNYMKPGGPQGGQN